MYKMFYFLAFAILEITHMLVLINVQAAEFRDVEYSMHDEQIKPSCIKEQVPVQAQTLSSIELENLHVKLLDLRERVASKVDNNPPSPPGLPFEKGAPTKIE